MTTYETMATPYLDAPVSFDHMTTAELMASQPAISYPSPVPYQASVNPAYHMMDRELTPSRQEMAYHSPTIAQRSPYASSYEGGFPEMENSSRSSPEAPSIERGNKLLSFQPSTCSHAVLDYSHRQSSLNIQAQLHGMFFLAESSRTLTGELASSAAELTCYRRNLFQITGNVMMPRMMQYVVNEQGERLAITSQELTISATESVEGTPVKIISVPWKTPATGQAPPPPEEKVEKEPSSISLDQSANHDVDSEFSVFPIAWKRLQFRVATANNGRRRELQQHFTIKLSVTATLGDGSKISLCDALSGPIIVRGRSPRNFQQRKDIPLSGSGVSMRKSMSVSPSMRRSSTLDSIHRPTPKLEPTSDAYSLSPSDALRRGSPGPNGFEWQHPMPNSTPVSPYHQSMPDLSRNTSLKRKAEDAGLAQLAVPQYDNSGRSSAPPDDRPRKLIRPRGATVGSVASSAYMQSSTPSASAGPTSGAVPTTTFTYSSGLPAPQYFSSTGFHKDTQAENSQLLHEYFPMGVDDWSQSDSIYRPHVTHIPPPVGGAPMGARGYYGDDLAA
jgi:hypothetical protein